MYLFSRLHAAMNRIVVPVLNMPTPLSFTSRCVADVVPFHCPHGCQARDAGHGRAANLANQ